ncbi:hypothetical protein [Erythrobacter crassostreae]|uniref:Uncharacterized protein n=1 Tax=Erythrobacter crassostreae TaxID=2828328 RepID=A0A9X1F114_9SPHN|nr:hypothetical protein [Erythrobacter crassostrea]MBV7258346.1 hypothetical protein [Erythrobacter crassostrea]
MHRSVKSIALLAAATVTALAAPASAQRSIELPDEAWVHPHSEIVVPTTLGGLPRTGAVEYAPDFLNLGFSFRVEGEELSIYIYRDTNGGVPVWFEQARIGIESREALGKPQLPYLIEPYSWPGAEVWQGQRGIYATPNSEVVKSTGLVLFSVNGWFVKLRASSRTRSPEELGIWIDSAFAELAAPASSASQPAIIPVEDCEEKLVFKKKAEDAKVDGASSLISALLGGMVAEKVQEQQESEEARAAVAWCRDSSLSATQVAYRANASTDSYLIALGDSGMGVSVAPDSGSALLSDAKKSKKQPFSITVITDDQRINFVPQNRLPSLERVLKIINENRRTSAVSTWGDNSTIELSPDSL